MIYKGNISWSRFK